MKVSRLLALAVGSTLCFILCLGACGLSYGEDHLFGVTFDGTNPTVDSGSTDPVGVSLSPGDSYLLDLHASAGNFWRVETPYTQSFPLSFIVNAGDRVGDIVALFQLNGVEVESIDEPNTVQSEVHIGAQNWTLPIGLEFDTVLLTYDLLSAVEVDGTEPVDTIIAVRPDIFGSISNPERPFFRNSNISFNAVPEPATFSLALLGFLATIAVRRK